MIPVPCVLFGITCPVFSIQEDTYDRLFAMLLSSPGRMEIASASHVWFLQNDKFEETNLTDVGWMRTQGLLYLFLLVFTMWCKYTHILYGLISFLCFPLSQAGYLHVFTHFRQVDLFFPRVFQCEFDAWIGWIPLPRCEIRITLGELKIVFNRIMMLGCRGSNPRIRLILDFQTVHWTVDRALVPIILFRRNDATTSFFKVIEPLQTKLNCSSQATGTEPPKIQFIYSTLKAGGHRSCSIYFYSTTADLSCCFFNFSGCSGVYLWLLCL